LWNAVSFKVKGSKFLKTSTQIKFWDTFANKYWEKNSLLVKNFKSSIIEIDETEIFKMLVDYSNKCRKLKSADGFKLFIKGQMLHEAEVLQFLPEKSDKNLTGYHSRMEKYFPDYCLVCDELLQASQENWEKLRNFTDNLFSHVGFPNKFVEMGLYLGNYRKTPFGVHVDGCGVFSFPVIGHKTFRLWKPSFAKKNPSLDRAMNYDRFKKSSTTIKASHGDMTYWPSSAWHIAESDGSFNATWSLGVWVDRAHSDNVELALKPLLKAKQGASGSETVNKNIKIQKDGETVSLPENYLQSISTIKNISEAELHDTFMHAWLKLASKQGFKTTSSSNLKISFSNQIKLPKSKSILWAQLKSKPTLIYAFGGLALEVPISNNFQNLVKDLNSGKTCKVSDYLKGTKKSQELKTFKILMKC
jgi:hypothetical protein